MCTHAINVYTYSVPLVRYTRLVDQFTTKYKFKEPEQGC